MMSLGYPGNEPNNKLGLLIRLKIQPNIIEISIILCDAM